MNCPKCTKAMKKKSKDVSHDSKTKVEYERSIYVCKKDDVWVTVEVAKPVKSDRPEKALPKRR